MRDTSIARRLYDSLQQLAERPWTIRGDGDTGSVTIPMRNHSHGLSVSADAREALRRYEQASEAEEARGLTDALAELMAGAWDECARAQNAKVPFRLWHERPPEERERWRHVATQAIYSGLKLP